MIAEDTIINNDNSKFDKEQFAINTNFNFDKISNLYSDLTSQYNLGLLKLSEDYETVNYSTIEIDHQFQKFYHINISYNNVNFSNCFNDELEFK